MLKRARSSEPITPHQGGKPAEGQDNCRCIMYAYSVRFKAVRVLNIIVSDMARAYGQLKITTVFSKTVIVAYLDHA